jgi:hypothetical protein
MPFDKAPRPDGLNGAFMKSYRHYMSSLINFVIIFFNNKLDLHSIIFAFITLPKKMQIQKPHPTIDLYHWSVFL